MSSYFFQQAEMNSVNAELIKKIENYSENNKQLIFVLNRPLTDQKYSYDHKQSLIILSPKYKVAIIDCSRENSFNDYVEDLIEDIGSIADKYLYKEIIGRTRRWRSKLVDYSFKLEDIEDIETFFNKLSINDELEKKNLELLISLFIGSINDIERVKEEVPETILDKIKQKIQLFDADQTRFIYATPEKKRITIQGLSGTGKTELLLHKLKDLYTSDANVKIYFTCHNKVLADTLRKRIPSFFNFMKVEQQIDWNEKLWCTNAWGAESKIDSGAYRYICAFYQIPFYRYSYQMQFSRACKLAIEDIKAKYINGDQKFAFQYMFIDESQDFDENFFELCELVTEKNIYVAGDIFQSIFDESISNMIKPDFLLGKCYRTDPKTLMFAHSLGMGLFEKNKLRWLDEDEWKGCGYNIDIIEGKYHLSREPLRRFEDFDENYESIKIVEITKSYSEAIIKLIKEIQFENKTVLPEDVGIILLDQDNDIYALADKLEILIQVNFNWAVNKAYETKEKLPNAVFLTNRNNVKGLEFPFIICVTKAIKDNSSYRNSLYTMLTRSFLKSYFVISNDSKSGLTKEMKMGLKEIVTNKRMVIQEPSEYEKKKIRTRFEYRMKKLSHYEIMMEVFRILRVDKKYHDKLFKATEQFDMLESSIETIKDFVIANLKYLK